MKNNDWLGVIYKKHHGALTAFLRKRGIAPEIAEDMINSVALSFLSREDIALSGATALFTATVKLNSYSKLQREAFEKNRDHRLFEAMHHDTPETSLMRKQDAANLLRAIRSLPNGQRKLMEARLSGQRTTSCRYAFSLIRNTMSWNGVNEHPTEVQFLEVV